MISGLRVAVVVPAYNEERLIARTLRDVPALVDQVIVVDDASADETAARARAVGDARVLVVSHPENRGVGAALVTGYLRAFSAGADAVVVMGGDGQMDPLDFLDLLAPIAAGEAEYVKGDRLAWPGARARMPLARFVGNHVLSGLTRLATGLSVHDSQCGYTALARAGAERLDLALLWPRYGYPNDFLGRAALAGLRVRDVPVRPVYGDEVSGVGWRHALFVVPYVLARVALRRAAARGPGSRGRRPPNGS